MTLVSVSVEAVPCCIQLICIALAQHHESGMIHTIGVELVSSLYCEYTVLSFRKIDTIAFTKSIQNGFFFGLLIKNNQSKHTSSLLETTYAILAWLEYYMGLLN